MAAQATAVQGPDKLGLVIQCRQKMDVLSNANLKRFANEVASLLTANQLKALLFSGLNATKHKIEYTKLQQIKSSVYCIIDEAKQTAASKSKKPIKSPPMIITKVPKDASLTESIPSDIISNGVCKLLKMASIAQLACASRTLSIICHSPAAITTLMHRDDPYRYGPDSVGDIDGVYNWKLLGMHRVQNADRLSLCCDTDVVGRVNSFRNLRHLSLFHDADLGLYPDDYKMDSLKHLFLQSLCFAEVNNTPLIIKFMEKVDVGQLKTLAFINARQTTLDDWNDDDDEDDLLQHYGLREAYNNLLDVLLPSKPNSITALDVLKFEESSFEQTDHPETDEANRRVLDIELVKRALGSLRGFAYAESVVTKETIRNLAFQLSSQILSNFTLFPKLRSVHIHSATVRRSFVNHIVSTSHRCEHVTELCLADCVSAAGVRFKFQVAFPNLEKLCLAVAVPCNADQVQSRFFKAMIHRLLTYNPKLKLFQEVAVLSEDPANTDPSFCALGLESLIKMNLEMVEAFNFLKTSYKKLHQRKRQLHFKVHVKVCHKNDKSLCYNGTKRRQYAQFRDFAKSIQDVVLNFPLTFWNSKMSYRFDWNSIDHPHDGHRDTHDALLQYFGGLGSQYYVAMKQSAWKKTGYCSGGNDHKTFAISVSTKRMTKRRHRSEWASWDTDCRMCCNSSWV